MKGRILKTTVMVLVLAALSASLYASDWSIGAEAAYNYTYVNTKTRFEGYSSGNFHGFDVAIPVEYRPLSWLSFSSGVRYIMKSETFRNVNTTTGSVISDYVRMHHFIEFPLTVRLSLNIDRLRFYIGGGGYVGVRVGEVHSGRSYSVDISDLKSFTAVMPLTETDNRFDAGLIAEGGVSYSFTPVSIYLAVRYQYGLTSLAAKQRDAVNTYLDDISATIGFMFNL